MVCLYQRGDGAQEFAAPVFARPLVCVSVLAGCKPPASANLQLRAAEPLRHIRLSRLLSDKLHAASVMHGPDLAAAMGALDPAVQQQVQAVLAAASAQPPCGSAAS